MTFLLSRSRTLGREVVRVLRSEAASRRTQRSDQEAARTPAAGGRAVPFTTAGRRRTRTLPARPVPLRTPADHRAALVADLERTLHAAGVPTATYSSLRDGGPVIVLADADWTRALGALVRSPLPVLLGGSALPAPADDLPLVGAPAPDRVREWTSAVVLDPAVTVEGGRVLARYAFESAVRLERWVPDEDGDLRAPTRNLRTDRLSPGELRRGPAGEEAGQEPAGPGPTPLTAPTLQEVTFPIDVVYTWVDGTDPVWLERKRHAVEGFTGHAMTEAAADDLRFVDHDELRYSLRSLERYAPWVRHVYLVTDGQRPAWLREDHPGLTVVDHRDIAPDAADLPTFNSHAIEANLHRIEGLSEQFLYFNDDVFLSSPVTPDLFFSANGLAHLYLSSALVGPGDPVPGEPASDTAGKNARAMVEEVCGRRLSRKLFHAPFALQRSVSREIEERWPEIVAATRASTFRRTADVTLSGALHMNYAFATARAVARGLRYRYVNVGALDAAERLAGLEQDRDVLATFCLNEADPALDPATIDRLVKDFLRRRFPDRSTFEVPG